MHQMKTNAEFPVCQLTCLTIPSCFQQRAGARGSRICPSSSSRAVVVLTIQVRGKTSIYLAAASFTPNQDIPALRPADRYIKVLPSSPARTSKQQDLAVADTGGKNNSRARKIVTASKTAFAAVGRKGAHMYR